MATTATARPAPSLSRRSPPVGAAPSHTTHGSTPSIAKGATARSAASSRVAGSTHGVPGRRASLRSGPPPVINLHGESRETLAAALKQETDQKEKLLVQLQDKETTISSLKAENHDLSSALHSAETRLQELYADQSRMEEELATRIEVVDKLRVQVKDLEKERRDTMRRYNEQTATFEAERQAFYDNEQHLKSRIQSLSQARKQPPPPPSPSMVSVSLSTMESERELDNDELSMESKQDMTDPEQEPAEMTALRLELSTLSTSHASIQATVALLQSQLVDLRRVNHELQEENESYNILLRERTLNGQFDIMRMGAVDSAADSDQSDDEEDEDDAQDAHSLGTKHSGKSRSTLDRVEELSEPTSAPTPHVDLDPAFEHHDEPEQHDPDEEPASRRSRHGRKRSSVAVPHGESLANLPITGPGLDLAAELGRAENKDMLDGTPALEEHPVTSPKARKGKKAHDSPRKVSAVSEVGADGKPLTDLDALRSEVKSLKDANKALSLYASKIIDRIISQEGFEHVLAADYERSPPKSATSSQFNTPNIDKARPQSAMFSRSSSTSSSTSPHIPHVERLTTFESIRAQQPKPAPPPNRASRRSMSFDWKNFSMFGGGGDKKPEPAPTMRPLTLTISPAVAGARKLDTEEDEEDRKERERLNATMKLMGIEKPAASPSSPLPPMLKSFSTPVHGSYDSLDNQFASPSLPTPAPAASPAPMARFSFFRRSFSLASRSEPSSVGSSVHGSPQPPAATPTLTQEALEQAEAENSLAALDAQERQLSAEIAKGSGGGFTEIVRRTGDRRSSRRSGSVSTVWSAGMSKHEDGED